MGTGARVCLVVAMTTSKCKTILDHHLSWSTSHNEWSTVSISLTRRRPVLGRPISFSRQNSKEKHLFSRRSPCLRLFALILTNMASSNNINIASVRMDDYIVINEAALECEKDYKNMINILKKIDYEVNQDKANQTTPKTPEQTTPAHEQVD